MIVGREPAASVEKRINVFMAELRALIPELESGVELVAESGKEMKNQTPVAGGGKSAPDIEPAWLQALENIQSGLINALNVYKKGDPQKAAELVIQTQFDDYKNSLFETAVRRHVSQKKDFENNSNFSEIAGISSAVMRRIRLKHRYLRL